MAQAFIFGGGGHARVLASIIDRDVTFVLQSVEGEGTISEDDFFEKYRQTSRPIRPAEAYLGIGNDAVRTRLFYRLKTAGIRLPACVSKTAFVARDAEVGEAAVIAHGAIIGPRSIIESNCIVNTMTSVDHDCHIGEHTQITVGCTLAGGVKIGADCYVGMKSGFFPGVSVGEKTVIRGGSLVIKNVPSNSVFGGNPAVLIRARA